MISLAARVLLAPQKLLATSVPLKTILVRHVGTAPKWDTFVNLLVPAGAIAAVRVCWRLNRQIRDTNGQPDDAWRNARSTQHSSLRACGAVPSAAALSHGDSAEKTFEERKISALETLADAARLWIRLNEPGSEEEGDDAGEADVEVD